MLALDDRRPRKRQRRDEGVSRFIEDEAEEDSDDYDGVDEYGDQIEKNGVHENQYYKPEELQRRTRLVDMNYLDEMEGRLQHE